MKLVSKGIITPHHWFKSATLDKLTQTNGTKFLVYKTDLENDYIIDIERKLKTIRTTRTKLETLEVEEINENNTKSVFKKRR